MGLSQVMIDFLQPVGVGVAAVLLLLAVVGYRLPRRSAMLARRHVKQ